MSDEKNPKYKAVLKAGGLFNGFDLGFASHRTIKLGPSRFGEPMTRLSEPGPGQWVAKTRHKTWVMGCGFDPTFYSHRLTYFHQLIGSYITYHIRIHVPA